MAIVGPCARSGQKNLGTITKLHLEIQQCRYMYNIGISNYLGIFHKFSLLAMPGIIFGTRPTLQAMFPSESEDNLSWVDNRVLDGTSPLSILPLHHNHLAPSFSPLHPPFFTDCIFLYLLSPLKSFFIGIIFMLKAICSTLS